MKLQGTIKSIKAGMAAGGADVTQVLQLDIHGPWKDLRDMMQTPLNVTLEPIQMELGKTTPPTGPKRGQR